MPSSGQKNSAMTGISIRVIDPLIPACGRLRPNYQLRRQRLPSQCAEDTAGKNRLKTKRPDWLLFTAIYEQESISGGFQSHDKKRPIVCST